MGAATSRSRSTRSTTPYGTRTARTLILEDIDMQTRNLAEKLSVSSQLTLSDLSAAADQGIRSIINNRPDGESPDQPTSAEIEAAAAALGLGYRHIPVVPVRSTMRTLQISASRWVS